jgi:hypothetical protein
MSRTSSARNLDEKPDGVTPSLSRPVKIHGKKMK